MVRPFFNSSSAFKIETCSSTFSAIFRDFSSKNAACSAFTTCVLNLPLIGDNSILYSSIKISVSYTKFLEGKLCTRSASIFSNSSMGISICCDFLTNFFSNLTQKHISYNILGLRYIANIGIYYLHITTVTCVSMILLN